MLAQIVGIHLLHVHTIQVFSGVHVSGPETTGMGCTRGAIIWKPFSDELIGQETCVPLVHILGIFMYKCILSIVNLLYKSNNKLMFCSVIRR